MSLADRWGKLLAAFLPANSQDEVKQLTVILACGRYDRPASAVRSFMRRFGKTSAVIGFTEMQDAPRAQALKVKGRSLIRYPGRHSGLREIAISVPNSIPSTGGQFALTDMTYHRVGGAVAPPKHCVFTIVTVNGRDVPIYVAHLPNTVGNTRFTDSQRAKVYKDCVRNFAKRANSATLGIAAFDWNARLDIPNEMRNFLDSEMEKAGFKRVHNTGIEGFYVKNLKVRSSSSLGKVGAFSDHPVKRLKVSV